MTIDGRKWVVGFLLPFHYEEWWHIDLQLFHKLFVQKINYGTN